MDKIVKRKRKKINQRKGSIYKAGLTKRATSHELILKEALIENGIVFYFQKVFFNHEKLYILDFYFKTDNGRFCVEIDGESHNNERQKEYDKIRTQWLFRKRKTRVIRFTNKDIDENLNNVLAVILMLKPRKIC